ncbi:hypothetical protein ACI2L4_25010 [Streptomyces sparsogenes]|uniref:hypothetical protein n=1 Tax=Streptomyces sparsogenes TaxID=67365 RepID=UPI00384A7C23
MTKRNRAAAVPRTKRRAWERTFERLLQAEETAQSNTLAAVYQARQDGLTQADIAYMLGGISPSGIAAKEAKGKKILLEKEGRKTTDE